MAIDTRGPQECSDASPAARVPFAQRVRKGQQVIYVRQVRSAIGAKPKTRRSLRALGLRGIGQSNLQPDTGSTRGSINRISHLILWQEIVLGSLEACEVAPEFHSDWWELNAAAVQSAAQEPSGNSENSSGDGGVTAEEYSKDLKQEGASGYRIVAPGGSLVVYVERYPNQSTVTWPTEMSADQLVPEVEEILGVGTEDDETALWLNGEKSPIPIRRKELSAKLKELSDNIRLVRTTAAGTGITVVWQRHFVNRKRFEGGIASIGDFPIKQLASVLGKTAIGSVGESSSEIAGRAADMLLSKYS